MLDPLADLVDEIFWKDVIMSKINNSLVKEKANEIRKYREY